MPMHIGLGMDFEFGGGGGGGAHTSARLKCVRDRKCVCEAKLNKIIQFLQLILCYGVTFSGT